MVQELRTNRRVDVDGDVRVLRARKGARLVKAYLDDISLGGFQMYAMDKVDIGEEVDFELMTPLYRDSLTGRGKVRYSRPVTKYNTPLYSMGVEFDKVSPQEIRQLIRLHVGRREKKGFFALHKSELRAFLLFLPVLIAIGAAYGAAVNSAHGNTLRRQKDAAYVEKAKDALIYFLYHAQ